MPSTGSRSCRALSVQTVPPCASVWWTARSRPFCRSSSCVPSSGHGPPSADARPQDGHSHAGRSAPSWTSSSSTRPSEADSSVFSQPGRRPPVAAGLLLPALRRDSFLPRVPLVHERLHRLEQLARARVRLGRRPADHGAADIVRERVLERRSRLLRGRRSRLRFHAAAGSAARAPRRLRAGGPRPASRCAAGSAPATTRPDRAAPAARRIAREPPRAGRPRAGRRRRAHGRRTRRARPRRGGRAERAARGRTSCPP